MIFYHYTCLYHLPEIKAEGLKYGEVPLRPDYAENAVNLTPNENWRAMKAWGAWAEWDKTRIRITVDIPTTDPALKPWKQTIKERNVSARWAKKLDNNSGQSKFWWHYFGEIGPDKILTVEIKEKGVYRELSEAEQQELIARINEERERCCIVLEDRPFQVYCPKGSFLNDGHRAED